MRYYNKPYLLWWSLLSILSVAFSNVNTANATELEDPNARQGYYLSAGAVGILNINHEDKHGNTGPWPGVGSELRMGQALTDWLDVGLGFGVNWAFNSEHRVLLGHLSMEGQLRPIDPLFIRIGFGFGFTDVTRTKSGAREIIGRVGGAYTVAVGYDFFPGRKPNDRRSGGIAISPYAGFQFGPSSPTSSYMAMIGISFTWWSGLNKNQLNLTVDEAYK